MNGLTPFQKSLLERGRAVGHLAQPGVEYVSRVAKPPSLPTQARSYISTLAEHIANGSKHVPEDVRQSRRTICNSCDRRNVEKDSCTVCGCSLNKTLIGDKLGWAVSSCPLGKWSKHLEVSVASTEISSHENRAGGAGISWPVGTIRHLLYHIYPVSNGHWRWNVEQLCGRLKAFNGHRIVAIAVDPPTGRLPDPTGPNSPDRGRHIPGCDSVEEVKAEFARRWSGEPITFMEFENDPSLREVKTFIPMLEQVLTDDPNHITLYAQAKGTTRHNGHIARRWTEALYEIMMDHFPLAEEMLKTHPVVGCFKKLGAGWSPEQSHSDWHYSGSWFWVKNAELSKKAYWKIDQFWSGIEPYPSQQFKADEAGCMFHTERVPEMNLYSPKYWKRRVTPEFAIWREENAKYRTEMWPK